MATQSHADEKVSQQIESILEEMPEVSEGTRRDFRRYFESGICTLSGFYLALLENDLWAVYRRADSENLERIDEWLSWMYWHIPANAWGGRDEVRSYYGIASSGSTEQEQR